ncbi:hypothetical protein [Mycobacterium avium]|uniref:hypothetical protein n=1 Tax=Mycobacterium avium TaxID=1764 RepID=UPI000CE4D5AF|nr:hypothetical protein [Mycobacterium avium]
MNDFTPARDTRYGHMSQQQYETRRADELLHEAAQTVCELCDDDGYKPNGIVCDHVDRSEIHKRGIAKVRAALAAAKATGA